MTKCKILHQDISINNILIVEDPDAEDGVRGVLIACELAKYLIAILARQPRDLELTVRRYI